MALQHLRSSTANKRPTPGGMSDGQLALNTNVASPGLFFKDSTGALVKVGPVHVGTTAPNATPASGGQSGNSVGEQWLDTTGGTYVFKVWDGSAWRSESGTFVDVNGDVMTGALGIIAGSAGSPSLYISGDTNTGIYSPGADQLALSTNGTGRLFVDSSGRVGVGTSSPTDTSGFGGTLDINGTTGAACYVRTNGSATNYGFIGHYGTDFYVNNNSNGPTLFFTNGGERLRITSAGLVGIGTSSVGDVLHVKGGSTYAGVIADNSAATGGGAFRAYRNGVQKAVFCVDSWVTGTSSDDAAIYADTGGGIKFYTNNSSTAKAVLTSGGSLGIGTTTMPADTNFTVLGNYQSGFYRNVTSGNRGYLLNIGAATSTGFADGGSITGVVESGDSTGYLTFGTRTSGTVTEKFRCDSSGRLLVGTSTSTNNLRNDEKLAIVSTGSSNLGGASFTSYGGTSAGTASIFDLQRSRGTTDGSMTAVASGDALGYIVFRGSDGTAFSNGAYIVAEVDTTVSTNIVPGRLAFYTTNTSGIATERMRIGSNGVVNTYNSSSDSFAVRSGVASGTSQYLYLGYSSATSVSNGTYVYGVFTNGNVENTNNSYGAISDIKLKENIVDANSQWDDIKALQVRNYNFKEGQTHTQIGLVAQEVELVSPGLVSESPDRDADGNDLGTVTKSVNYSVLYMKAVKALQEAMERIETLEAKVAALESA